MGTKEKVVIAAVTGFVGAIAGMAIGAFVYSQKMINGIKNLDQNWEKETDDDNDDVDNNIDAFAD